MKPPKTRPILWTQAVQRVTVVTDDSCHCREAFRDDASAVRFGTAWRVRSVIACVWHRYTGDLLFVAVHRLDDTPMDSDDVCVFARDAAAEFLPGYVYDEVQILGVYR